MRGLSSSSGNKSNQSVEVGNRRSTPFVSQVSDAWFCSGEVQVI